MQFIIKDIEQYTKEEILNLSEEQIKLIKQANYIKNNIPIISKPRPAQPLPQIETKTAYCVTINYHDWIFENKDEADNFYSYIKTLKVKETNKLSPSLEDIYVLKNKNMYMAYSNIEFIEEEQGEDYIAKYDIIIKDIEQQKEQAQLYKSYLQKTKELDSRIDDYIYGIRRYHTFIKEQADLLLNTYLVLANNDFEIAFKYLIHNYNLTEEEQRDIKEEYLELSKRV